MMPQERAETRQMEKRQVGERQVGETRQIWRDARSMLAAPPEPDAMSLAAYAERRSGRTEIAAVEAWLAHNPERWDDIRAARATMAGASRASIAARSVRATVAGVTAALALAVAVIAFNAGSDSVYLLGDHVPLDVNMTGELDDFAL